ncbi:hypothetical protein [Pectinatus cerevisiiphilus]|uniref:Uncharacterized protein n=1 Tax=Pectinatus cerevisiiphilus TaxID=86956 RepID=A0A4R3K4W3_9FIRM|nr:hypothetical protein [Pectinatus cerevisiiphilus]TCS77806.1 hypothetical protein EDC37_11343 [Pectinatus cerevisiiphilus]
MNTLIIIAAIFLWIVSLAGKKKKTTSSQRRLPPIRRPQATKSADPGKKTLDYMMKRPQNENTAPLPEQPKQPIPTEIKTSEKAEPLPHKQDEQKPVPAFSSPPTPREVPANILFQQAVTKAMPSLEKKDNSVVTPLNIDKKNILCAITYAEVLNPPKSLKYLERYGIKRFPIK